MGDKETKTLLKSCAENLLNAVSHLENRPQVSSTVDPVAPVAPVVPVVEEHRRLFGHRPPNNNRASSSTSSRNRKQSASMHRVVATLTGDRVSIPVGIHGQELLSAWKKEMQPLPLQLLKRYRWL